MGIVRLPQEPPYRTSSSLGHESLRQRFIPGLLKAREYAWPEVAQRIMNYYQELLDERGSSSMRPRSRALYRFLCWRLNIAGLRRPVGMAGSGP